LNDQQVNCPERNPGTPSMSSVCWQGASQFRARSRQRTKLAAAVSLLRTSNSPQRQRLHLMDRDRAGGLWPNFGRSAALRTNLRTLLALPLDFLMCNASLPVHHSERAIPRRAMCGRLLAKRRRASRARRRPLPLGVREWYGTVHGAGHLIGFTFRRCVRPSTRLDTRTG
jgi:hypothetical protein